MYAANNLQVTCANIHTHKYTLSCNVLYTTQSSKDHDHGQGQDNSHGCMEPEDTYIHLAVACVRGMVERLLGLPLR